MNLALFFEGTGQGVHGKRTNVSLCYEACVEDSEQKRHLESGPGTNFGYFLRGAAAGYDWRKIFASARRWFEANYKAKSAVEVEDPNGNTTLRLQTSTSTRVYLFGFSRGALLARHFAAWLDKLGVEVEYLGLWDTVDATPGLDVSETCPPNVRFARHAVAEHEARRFFAYVPLRVNEVKGGGQRVNEVKGGGQRVNEVKGGGQGQQRNVSSSAVEEVLFPGVHSDVGGLYEDNHELADVARAWVLEPAVRRGLRLKPGAEAGDTIISTTAVRHDSLRHISNLFGLLKPLRRIFPKGMRRSDKSKYGIISADETQSVSNLNNKPHADT